MTLHELNYEAAARWVVARCTTNTTLAAVSQALKALGLVAAATQADSAVEGLFPGSSLEVLVSRVAVSLSERSGSAQLPAEVDIDAVRAIGEAIDKEMEATGKKLLTLVVDDCGELVVYRPEMRETVLLGSRTALLA